MLASSPVRHAATYFSSRVASRILAASLACSLFASAVPAQAAAPDASEIERLYNEGNELNARKDYAGAADSWTRLLMLLPEQGSNLATRENILLNVLEAHLNAYHGMRKADNTKDIVHLQNGKKTLERYLQQYRAVYGDRRAISAAVQQRSDELDEALRKAEETPAPIPAVSPARGPAQAPKERPQIGPDVIPPKLPPQNNGVGLIVGGSIAVAAGFGALGMAIAGAVAGPKYEKTYEDAQADARAICPTYPTMGCSGLSSENQTRLAQLDADRVDADRKGHRANALTIAGSVLAPILAGGGVAMLVVGIKRHRAAQVAHALRLTPVLGGGYAGLSAGGRF